MLLHLTTKYITNKTSTRYKSKSKSKMNQQQFNNNNNTLMSIYIPRISTSTTENEVISMFYKYRIGEVGRVDFTPINKKAGFGKDVDSIVKSAFVHFSRYYNDQETLHLLKTLQNDKSYRLQLDESNSNLLNVKYWLLLKAKTTIPYTMMNNHQIVENCRLLEKQVVEQEQRIQKLESLVNCLLERRNPYAEYDGEYQDDELQIMKFRNNVRMGLNKCTIKEDDNSSHSSMPDLITGYASEEEVGF
jgi:hypothetical protein